jgi:hypothetical protein
MASDCRASNGRMSFAGCDDLVLNAGTADMVLNCDVAVATLLTYGPDILLVPNTFLQASEFGSSLARGIANVVPDELVMVQGRAPVSR